jgi:hypothetical protein
MGMRTHFFHAFNTKVEEYLKFVIHGAISSGKDNTAKNHKS